MQIASDVITFTAVDLGGFSNDAIAAFTAAGAVGRDVPIPPEQVLANLVNGSLQSVLSDYYARQAAALRAQLQRLINSADAYTLNAMLQASQGAVAQAVALGHANPLAAA